MNERRMLAVLTSVLALQCVSGMFYHAPSSVILRSTSKKNNTDFGFSMAYMDETKTLVVGAPKADRIGKIFNCVLDDVESRKKKTCGEQYMEIDSSSYDTEHYPDQHFHLGATIVATKDYFFTCAPLWTTTVKLNTKNGKKEFTDVFGTCFIQDTKTTRYRGLLENYQHDLPKYRSLLVQRFRAGTGWSTLIDEKNDLLLITKTATRMGEDFFYLPASNPFTNVNSLQMQQQFAAKQILEKRWNIGFGLAAGKFFSQQTVYAFSVLEQFMEGSIYFLKSQKKGNVVRLYFLETGKNLHLSSDAVGTMFGTTMGAADLNLDGLDELLVGAPAQSKDECVECGALHIYLGGDDNTVNERKRLRSIYGTAHLGRFSTAIATKDIDGDGKPEIVVSAPYEDHGSGAIYILSGYEIHNTLMKTVDYKSIQLTDLKLTQRIHKESYRALGFSLQFVTDVDANACDELAASSPGSSTVLLFKCVQKINVTLSSHLIGNQTVREQDSSFIVEVCARVTLPPNLPEEIVGNLTVQNSCITTSSSAEAPVVKNQSIVIDISCFACERDRSNLCENVTVELTDKEPAYYKFTSKAVLHNIFLADPNTTVFNSSWVETSPYSKLDASLEVSRHCNGDDCKPNLSLELSWSGGKKYLLGSTVNETAKITLSNKGNASYSSCLWLKVTGAPLYQVGCQAYQEGYKCYDNLPKPLKRDTNYSIELVLNMTKPTNVEEELLIVVYLYENCNQENVNTSKTLVIPFDLPSEGVFYDGDDHKLNITDKQISAKEIVSDHQEFVIRNNGTITWKQVNFTVAVPIQLYIHSFYVTATDFGKCEAENLEKSSFIIYHCTLDELPPNTTRTIIGTTEILAARISDYVKAGKLNMTSRSELFLSERVPAIITESVTRISIVKEITLANRKWLIALIAGIVALIILAIVTIILWKCGFFRRKQKQQLLVMKDSIRRTSVRRITYNSARDGIAEGIQMDVDDDCPFPDAQPVTTKDNVGLVVNDES